MKKTILIISLLLLTLSYQKSHSWFFGGSKTFDIYSVVSENISSMEDELLVDMLTSGGDKSLKEAINDEINKENELRGEDVQLRLLTNDIDLGEIISIVNGINAQKILMEKLDIESIDVFGEFTTYYVIISNFYYWALTSSQNMSENIESMRNIGKYMDGNEDNSPFDLIIDLEQINDVIFNQPFYYPGNSPDFRNYTNNRGNNTSNNNTNEGSQENKENDSIENKDKIYPIKGLSEQEIKMLNNTGLFEVCPIEGDLIFKDSILDNDKPSNDSNLGIGSNDPKDDDSNMSKLYDLLKNDMGGYLEEKLNNNAWCLDYIITLIAKNLNENLIDYIAERSSYKNELDEMGYYDFSKNEKKSFMEEYLIESLEKNITNVRNKIIDVDIVACVEIGFDFYNQSFFGGAGPSSGKRWFTGKTLEQLIEESISNLGEIINKSFIQSEMSQNNFELGLKNFRLSDIFNIGFQIIRKPVPIKKGTPKTVEPEKDDYNLDNFIRNVYMDLNLDINPNRINKISNIQNIPEFEIIRNNSTELSYINFQNRLFQIQNQSSQDVDLKTQIRDMGLQSKIRSDIYSDFLGKFSELERFTNGLIRYGEDLRTIIRGMNRIPLNE